MKEYLRAYVDSNLTDWPNMIEYCIFTMNTSISAATRYTPFELLYGFKCEIPNSLRRSVEPVYNYDDYISELRYRLQKSHEFAREKQISNKEQSKRYYDRNFNQKMYEVGDEVYVLSEKQKGEGRKLQPLYDGPYEVTRIVSDVNTEIQIGRKKIIVHNNRLKLCTN